MTTTGKPADLSVDELGQGITESLDTLRAMAGEKNDPDAYYLVNRATALLEELAARADTEPNGLAGLLYLLRDYPAENTLQQVAEEGWAILHHITIGQLRGERPSLTTERDAVLEDAARECEALTGSGRARAVAHICAGRIRSLKHEALKVTA